MCLVPSPSVTQCATPSVPRLVGMPSTPCFVSMPACCGHAAILLRWRAAANVHHWFTSPAPAVGAPHPAAVGVQDAPASLLGVQWELAYYLPAAQDYMTLPCKVAAVNSARSSSLLLVAEAPLAALEWQVVWVTPAGEEEAFASATLRHLHINPRASPALKKAAASLGVELAVLPVPTSPLTVVVTADGGSLSLLGPSPLLLPPSAVHEDCLSLVQSLAVLHADSLRLALHNWPEAAGLAPAATAVDAQAVLSLGCTDSSSLAAASLGTQPMMLVEPFTLDVVVEVVERSAHAAPQKWAQQQQHHHHQQHHQQQPWQSFWQPAQQQCSDLSLLTVRQRPTRPGTAVAVQAAAEPLRLNASELTVTELQRLAQLLSAAEDAAAPEPPPVTIGNATGMDLVLRQRGTAEELVLPQGCIAPYCWPCPPALFPGAVRQLLLAWARGPNPSTRSDASLRWSDPVEVSGVVVGATS